MCRPARHMRVAFATAAASILLSVSATAQPFAYRDPGVPQAFRSIDREYYEDQYQSRRYQVVPQEDESSAEVPAHLRRQMVVYQTREAPGTIVIDTANTYLYYVLGNGRAIRYGIGVGREGFTWAGTERVTRKAEWPDWHPPAEMIQRQPYLPRFMAGGPGNPLGARALYLGNSIYRVHGTNQPSSIGQRVSSGCIRLLNEDVVDLYSRVNVGTRVVVLRDAPRTNAVARSQRAIERKTTVYSEPPVVYERREAPVVIERRVAPREYSEGYQAYGYAPRTQYYGAPASRLY
jgi:lipoprotein-anchoring transpeptidase ErfK/SrfK